MMRAAVLQAFGGPEHFQVQEVPEPVCGPGELLVEIAAASVNPVDWKMREGYQRLVMRRRPPMILGLDFSGTVRKVGPGVTRWQVGDEVYGSPNHKKDGTYARRAVVRADECAARPRNLSHQEAASIPLVGLTCWQALIEYAGLRAGESVMIEAGAGGIGSFALQLARHLGATVATTCSPHNEARVRELGATEVVNHQQQHFDQVLPPQDVVFEMMGADSRERALRALKPGGRLVSINSNLAHFAKDHGPTVGLLRSLAYMIRFSARAKVSKNVSVSNVIRKPSGAQLAQITALLEQGAIRPCVDRVYSLDQIADAHRYSQSGRAQGKIVIDMTAM